MPDPTEPPVDTTDDPADPDASGTPAAVTKWQYTGPVERVYTAIPITVAPGDVIDHAGPPADDGCWKPTRKAVTRQPDNTPKE